MLSAPNSTVAQLERALVITERRFGHGSPKVVGIVDSLAAAYFSEGRYEAALAGYRRMLRIETAAHGRSDPRVAKVLNNLAVVNTSLGHPREAARLYRQAIKIFQSAYGPDHPVVATLLKNLANTEATHPAAFQPAHRRPAPATQLAHTVLSVPEGGSGKISASADVAVKSERKRLTYAWDMDEDGTFEATGKTVAFDASKIDGPSTRIVRVRVSDGDGGVTQAAMRVEVTNVEPTADAGGPYTTEEGKSIVLTGKGSDPSALDRESLTYDWDLDGDGRYETHGRSVTFNARDIDGPAKVKVSLRVSDKDGGSSVATTTVNVVNVAPTVDVGGPYSVEEGGRITLSAVGKDASAADMAKLDYAWDLDGDGAFEAKGNSATVSAEGVDGPSTMTVRVRVTDHDGASHTAKVPIAVVNGAPTVDAGGPYYVDEGQKITVSAIGYDPSRRDRESLSFAWDLDGDGKFEVAGRTAVFDATEIDGPATRRIRVRVRDKDGGVGEDEATVEIRNVAPKSVIFKTGG